MRKNVIIFSDGTGQRGGILFDERRSNIYKLYRATRCGPDSCVDPKDQLAFYDPGIGTLPPGMGFLTTAIRWIYNLVSQALGIGLTRNMIDCYAAIVRVWRPGDRIFLFGFSRGAYTIRCLGAVIALCGIPEKGKRGTPLKLDETASKRIAAEAVKTVYQHTSSWKFDEATDREKELLAQRRELGRRFRAKYYSGTDQEPNVYPYFIGVFDTVASLANPRALAGLILIGLFVLALLGIAIWYFLVPSRSFFSFLVIVGGLTVSALVIGFAANFATRFKSEIGLPRRLTWRFFHLAEKRMKFYDNQLNENVGYARHAISIDESRTSFERVRWGDPAVWRETGNNDKGERNPIWFEQLWFAGNHSDIGGSYPENESRLSDITLKWMLDAACRVGLRYDAALLRLYPDPAGPQHDETKSSRVFRHAGKAARKLRPDFPLHDSVIQRFEAGEVLHYDVMQRYRPENLRNNQRTAGYYEQKGTAAR
jgi:uncharacterized protein (DUF2235 family)